MCLLLLLSKEIETSDLRAYFLVSEKTVEHFNRSSRYSGHTLANDSLSLFLSLSVCVCVCVCVFWRSDSLPENLKSTEYVSVVVVVVIVVVQRDRYE